MRKIAITDLILFNENREILKSYSPSKMKISQQSASDKTSLHWTMIWQWKRCHFYFRISSHSATRLSVLRVFCSCPKCYDHCGKNPTHSVLCSFTFKLWKHCKTFQIVITIFVLVPFLHTSNCSKPWLLWQCSCAQGGTVLRQSRTTFQEQEE